MARIITKDPKSADKMLASLDWTRWLGTAAISTSSWVAQSKGGATTTALTLSDDSNTTTTATVYFAGGTENDEYWLVNTIVTNEAIPRTESRSIMVRCARKVVG